jgi:methyl-accepting chemotaxis protein
MPNQQYELEQLASSMAEAATALRANDTQEAAGALDKVAQRLSQIAREIATAAGRSGDNTSGRNLPPQD